MDGEFSVAFLLATPLNMSPNGLNGVRTCFATAYLANCWCCINLTPVIQFGRCRRHCATVSSANEDSYQCDAIISSAGPSPPLSTANKHLNEHTHLWFYQHQNVLQAHKLKKAFARQFVFKILPAPMFKALSLCIAACA